MLAPGGWRDSIQARIASAFISSCDGSGPVDSRRTKDRKSGGEMGAAQRHHDEGDADR
jgi:hypothetical protein